MSGLFGRRGRTGASAREAAATTEVVNAAQRSLLGHLERDLALEGHHAVLQGGLTMTGPWEVLVIEDDVLDRGLVAELLAVRGRGGVRITEAGDLKSGLAALDQRRFHLVMLDTKLPEATALHALRAVGEKAPLTPILPHPAYISVQSRQIARQRGAFDVVVRGDLNPMWAAVNKLLTLSTLAGDIRPAAPAVEQ